MRVASSRYWPAAPRNWEMLERCDREVGAEGIKVDRVTWWVAVLQAHHLGFDVELGGVSKRSDDRRKDAQHATREAVERWRRAAWSGLKWRSSATWRGVARRGVACRGVECRSVVRRVVSWRGVVDAARPM